MLITHSSLNIIFIIHKLKEYQILIGDEDYKPVMIEKYTYNKETENVMKESAAK